MKQCSVPAVHFGVLRKGLFDAGFGRALWGFSCIALFAWSCSIEAMQVKIPVRQLLSPERQKELDLRLFEVCKRGGHVDEAQRLLDNGADADMRHEGQGGCSPLHYAAVHGSVSLAQLLISRGACPNASSYWRITPLYLASECGKIEMVTFLLQQGADVNTFGKLGEMPFGLAIDRKDLPMASLLCAHGGAYSFTQRVVPGSQQEFFARIPQVCKDLALCCTNPDAFKELLRTSDSLALIRLREAAQLYGCTQVLALIDADSRTRSILATQRMLFRTLCREKNVDTGLFFD